MVLLVLVANMICQADGNPANNLIGRASGLERGSHTSKLDSVGAQVFATSLRQVIEIIGDQYVRPVKRDALAIAGLKALHEAAQVPFPPQLIEDLRRAHTDEFEVGRILFRAREKLGTRTGLAHPEDLRVCIAAMLAILDPHSVVLNESQLDQDKSRPASAVGLEFEDYSGTGPLHISQVALGSPAQRAGLRPKDEVSHVNQVAVSGFSAGPVRLPVRSHLMVTTRHPGASIWREVTIKTEAFRTESVLGVRRQDDHRWSYWQDAENRLAHVRLDTLEPGTAEELSLLLGKLCDDGMSGLLLDLRWCPGGSLLESRLIADLFLAPYGIGCFMMPTPMNWIAWSDAYLDSHDRSAQVLYRDGRLDSWGRRAVKTYWTFPMIVLINGDSSGGGELIAAVLQDHGRARVMGQRSRGKGSVQSVLDFRESRALVSIPGMGMKLSSGILIRPSGRNLHRFTGMSRKDQWGVDPLPEDEIRVSARYADYLRDQWRLVGLRPGPSREVLVLDNPLSDPQARIATDALAVMASHNRMNAMMTSR